VQICANCGEENPARFRLCGFCGAQLAPELPPQEVRKTVTIVRSNGDQKRPASKLARRVFPAPLDSRLDRARSVEPAIETVEVEACAAKHGVGSVVSCLEPVIARIAA